MSPWRRCIAGDLFHTQDDCCCDPRVITKYHGKIFLKILCIMEKAHKLLRPGNTVTQKHISLGKQCVLSRITEYTDFVSRPCPIRSDTLKSAWSVTIGRDETVFFSNSWSGKYGHAHVQDSVGNVYSTD